MNDTKKPSSREICMGCDTQVYLNEKVVGIQLPYHEQCFSTFFQNLTF